MKQEDYNHQKIEKEWQSIWEKKKVYKTENNSKRKKYYVLDMFPYPSGKGLHVGHPKGYIGSDVFARMKRMQGFNVLHPMGYDAFGLPAEQYAITHNIAPQQAVVENVKTFENQLSIIGLSYDWDRKVNTTDPEFYHWTQWIFLKIYDSWYDKKQDKARPIAELIKIFEKSGNDSVEAVTGVILNFDSSAWKSWSEKWKQDVLMKYRLAYEGQAEVNWCPELGTVLANDEVLDGENGTLVSERGGFPVEKRQMRQWFMRITAYADRLLSGLDSLDWPEHIKEIQRNWIGRSVGAEINFAVDKHHITVFTTRPDTLFGVTFLAISPELAQTWLDIGWPATTEVKEYIKNNLRDRQSGSFLEKEKTGIFAGFDAINPATKEKVPVWIVNYVLGNVGTGAVMGVPAHDERDWKFAKKYNLPIKEVLVPNIVDKRNPPVAGKKIVERKNVHAIVRDPKNGKYLALHWPKYDWTTFPMGGIEEGEDVVTAAKREVAEESGFINLKLVKVLDGQVRAEYFAAHKDQNRVSYTTAVMFDLVDHTQVPVAKEESDMHNVIWLDQSDLDYEHMTHAEVEIWKEKMNPNYTSYMGEGILINSENFSGMKSEEAREKITKSVGGKIVAKYKMRDAIFARQRYWGEPIPLVYDAEGVIKPLPEKSLPLKLPDVESYKPTGTGESPLASVLEWTKKGYETNTMPGWASSSWYFLRYMDPQNKKVFADPKAIEYWKNVDLYVGGAEHATGHLLYARFWHKFLKDYGLVEMEEPFQRFKNPGMILGEDNRKMSKRWGNVINPDDVVKTYGADTLRIYEMFMGPFDGSLPWSTENIIGSRRFIEKVWRLWQRFEVQNSKSEKTQKNESSEIERLLHKTVQKVTEDISNFAFNTAVSAMMILVNEMEKSDHILEKYFEMFLKILSPFAPHVTEEIWHRLGHKTLIVCELWPEADLKKIKETEVKIVVQVNSKIRAEFFSTPNSSEEEVIKKAKALPAVDKWLAGKEIKKVIYIPDKLLNIVV